MYLCGHLATLDSLCSKRKQWCSSCAVLCNMYEKESLCFHFKQTGSFQSQGKPGHQPILPTERHKGFFSENKQRREDEYESMRYNLPSFFLTFFVSFFVVWSSHPCYVFSITSSCFFPSCLFLTINLYRTPISGLGHL